MAPRRPRSHSDPAWSETPEHCLWCGYSLRDLAAPGVCPECGAPFDANILQLIGVPDMSTGAPTWRRIAWVVVIGAGIFYFYIGWALMLLISPLLAGAAGLTIIAALVWLVIVSPRERAGAERFFFTNRGVVRAPLKQGRRDSGVDSILIPHGDANAVELKRVSPYWRKLRIGVVMGPGARMHGVVFRAGIRCPDVYEERVRDHIEALLSAGDGRSAASGAPTGPLDDSDTAN